MHPNFATYFCNYWILRFSPFLKTSDQLWKLASPYSMGTVGSSPGGKTVRV